MQNTAHTVTNYFRGRQILLLTSVFTLSRIVFYVSGVHMDLEFIEAASQCIEPALLKDNLWESIWYLHAQPPLYNLFIGLILKFSPVNYAISFQIVYWLIGYVHTVALFKLLRALRINDILSMAVALFCTISATCILYENWLMYSYVELVALTISALLFVEFLRTTSVKILFLFFLTLSLLALTRSMFHLLWFLIIMAAIFAMCSNRLMILKAAALPLFLLLFWYGKNFVLFNKFTASTTLGMNISRIAMPHSGIAKYSPLDTVTNYYRFISKTEKYKHVAVLHKILNEKPAGFKTIPNYNHIDYIEANDQFFQESLQEIKSNPGKYFSSVLKAGTLFFNPATDQYWISEENRERIKYYTAICSLQFPNLLYKKLTGRYLYGLFLPALVAWVIGILLIIYILCMHFFHKRHIPKRHIWILFYILFNIIYVAVVSNFLEYGENNRFRFTTNAFMFVIYAYISQYFLLSQKKPFHLQKG